MTPELQNKLYEKYPKIFGQKDLPMNQTSMCWGITCEDGWYALIDALCQHLQFDTDNNNRVEQENRRRYPQIEAVQVKEKFGGLRFYTNGETDVQYGAISFAEHMSYHICERCGTTVDVTTGENEVGWIQSLCKNCRNKSLEEK